MIESLEGRTFFSATPSSSGPAAANSAVDRRVDVTDIGTVSLSANGTLRIGGLGISQTLTVARRSGAAMAGAVMHNPRAKLTDAYVFPPASPWLKHLVFDRAIMTTPATTDPATIAATTTTATTAAAAMAAVNSSIREAAGDGAALLIQAPGGSNVIVPLSLVRRIRIDTLGGDDRVVLKGVVRATTVLGGDGDDTLSGDAGTPRLTLDGGAGRDRLFGAPGSVLIDEDAVGRI